MSTPAYVSTSVTDPTRVPAGSWSVAVAVRPGDGGSAFAGAAGDGLGSGTGVGAGELQAATAESAIREATFPIVDKRNLRWS
jgi:hypothetical protein